MKDKYIKYLVIGMVVAGVFAVFGYYQGGGQKQSDSGLGASSLTNFTVLAGSASNLVSLPRSNSYSAATTTDATDSFSSGAQLGFLDGGATITQRVTTGGQNFIRLNMLLKAGTATSSIYIKQETSEDDVNYFTVHASSTANALFQSASTTVTESQFNTPAGAQFSPKTVSTTYSLLFDTYGSKFTRFIFRADDLLTDPSDGVQAFIQAVYIEPIVR